MARVAYAHHRDVFAEHSQIATGIDRAARDARSLETRKGAIDRKTLGDATQVDPDRGMSEADAVAGHQLDVGTGLQGRARRGGAERNVEYPGRGIMELARGAEDLIGPGMDANSVRGGLEIEPAHVAAGVVGAHEAVHLRDGLERTVDRSIEIGPRGAAGRDFHEGSEHGPRPARAIEGRSHKRPGFV